LGYQDKPTAAIRAALKEVLTNNVGSDVTVYDYFPTEGVREPCVVMQNIYGTSSETALGEIVGAAERGHGIMLGFQFDVYASTPTSRDQIADKLLLRIWSERHSLKTASGIELLTARRIQDVPAGEAGERLYRKSIDIPFKITMTKAA